MVQSLYYRHSGQFSLAGAVGGTLVAGAIGSLLGALYAALILYIPFAGIITFVLAIGFGVVLGLSTAGSLRRAKVRHEGIAFLSSAIAASAAFYVSWTVWTWLVLRQSDVQTELLGLVQSPAVVWSLLGQINTVGAWSISGLTPTDAVLWVLWGAEAFLILAPAVLVPMGVLAVPFCERCEVWCEPSEDAARVAHGEPDTLKERLEAKEIDVLEKLGAPAPNDGTWIRADLHDCPSCGDLHTLTLKTVSVTVNESGERDETDVEILSQLLITTQEAQRVRDLPATAIE